MVFLNALGAMTSITLLVLIGLIITRMGWISPQTEAFIPRLVVRVVIPPYLLGMICEHVRPEQLFDLLRAGLVPMAAMLATFALWRLAARVFRVDGRRRNLFAMGACLSNTIFIGLPVNTALFGESSTPCVLAYFFANTVFFWTLGAYVIAAEGEDRARRPTLLQSLRRVFSLPLLAIIAGVALVALGLRPPRVVMAACSYLGGMSAPLALIYVGTILCRTGLPGGRMAKDLALCAAGRMAVSPLVILTMLWFVDLPLLMKQVLVLQAGLPTMANIAIYSGYFGADREFGSAFVAVSTIAGLAAVPVWMTVIDAIF